MGCVGAVLRQCIAECLAVVGGRARHPQEGVDTALLRVVVARLRLIRGAQNCATQHPAEFSRIGPSVPWIHDLDGSWAFATGRVPDPRDPTNSGKFQVEVLSEVS